MPSPAPATTASLSGSAAPRGAGARVDEQALAVPLGSSGAWHWTARTDDVDHHARAQPQWSQEYTQLSSGRFHGLVQWLGWLWPYATLLLLLVRISSRDDEA